MGYGCGRRRMTRNVAVFIPALLYTFLNLGWLRSAEHLAWLLETSTAYIVLVCKHLMNMYVGRLKWKWEEIIRLL